MKRPIRIGLFAVVIILALLVIPQLILSYPVILFGEKFVHRNFNILSDRSINPDYSIKLDSIAATLSLSGFYKDETPLTIVLCHAEGKAEFIDKISMVSPGAGFHHFSGNIFLFPDRIEQFRIENEKITGEEKVLVQYAYMAFKFEDILTHEILHKLHADTMGIWNFRRRLPPPHWKAEGFAEYYTYRQYDPEDPEQYFLERLIVYEKYKDKFPLFYMKSRLMYEYLVFYKQLSFTEIMQEEITEESVYTEMVKMLDKKMNLTE